MVDERDYPPIKCKCGCKKEEKRNEQFDDGCLIEYDLFCAGCGKYLGHFAYGNWTY